MVNYMVPHPGRQFLIDVQNTRVIHVCIIHNIHNSAPLGDFQENSEHLLGFMESLQVMDSLALQW